MYGKIFCPYIFSIAYSGGKLEFFFPVYEVVWEFFKSNPLVQDEPDRAGSFCNFFVILCSFRETIGPLNQIAGKGSWTPDEQPYCA